MTINNTPQPEKLPKKKTSRRKKLIIVGTVIFTLLLVTTTVISVYSAYIFTHPMRLPIDKYPENYNMTVYENVTISSTEGIKLYGWFIPAQNNTTEKMNIATIILAHGYNGNRVHMLRFAEFLYKAGYNTLLFDFRAHGTSEGSVTTIGLKEAEDAISALKYLQTRGDVNSSRIFLFGMSMGGAASIIASSYAEQNNVMVRGLITDSAFAELKPIAEKTIARTLPAFPFVPLVIYFAQQYTKSDVNENRPVKYISTLRKTPVLLIHGSGDTLVPVDDANALYDNGNVPKQKLIFENVEHGQGYESYKEKYEQTVLDFVAQNN